MPLNRLRAGLAALVWMGGAAAQAAVPATPTAGTPAATAGSAAAAYADDLLVHRYATARAGLLRAASAALDHRQRIASTEAACVAVEAAAAAVAAAPDWSADPSLRDAVAGVLAVDGKICREELIAMARLLSTEAMTEATVKEADTLYMDALTEEAELHAQVLVAQARFAKKHKAALRVIAAVDAPRPALPALPETGLGLDEPMVAAAAVLHHAHLLGQMQRAIDAVSGLVATPLGPNSPVAEALPGVVTRVSRARVACDEAGPWFDDDSLQVACTKLTNGLSRLLSGPMAELSLLGAEPRWSARQTKRAEALLSEVQSEMPLYVGVVAPASSQFLTTWGGPQLQAWWAQHSATPP